MFGEISRIVNRTSTRERRRDARSQTWTIEDHGRVYYFIEGILEATDDKLCWFSLGAYGVGWWGGKVDGKDTVRGNVVLYIV